LQNSDFNWRVEEACRNAWPAPREFFLDGWIFRFSGGQYRRPNAVSPLKGARRAAELVIPAAEALYRACGQAVIFRVIEIADEIDTLLAAEGYALGEAVLTLAADLRGVGAELPHNLSFSSEATPEWLEAKREWDQTSDADHQTYRTMLATIVAPKIFAALTLDEQIVSRAYGVLHDGLLVLESVATHPACRQRGLGRQAIGGLLAWGKAAGAEAACLQVVANNTPALALYRSLGFRHDLYRYHYRTKA
jgi:ribosomal protein S18 acetylase RimI-like enzyme